MGVFLNNFKRSFNHYNNGSHFTIVNYILATNCAVFIYWKTIENDRRLSRLFLKNFTLCPNNIYHGKNLHTLVTSFFSHTDLSHFLFNMLGLYSFGNNLLPILNLRSFSLLYFGGGLVSSVCTTLWPLVVPKSWPAYYKVNEYALSLGASGAINAVVAYSILMFPTSTLLIYGVIPIPSGLAGLAFIAYDGISLYYGGSNIGNAAHLSGAVFGALFYLLTRRRHRFR